MSDDRLANDMVERVAREIARYVAIDDGKTPEKADDFTDAVWSDFTPAACAVLKAMREPTSNMISAALRAAPSSDIMIQWPRMIDAALTGDEPAPVGG